jgi:hypothetical protein
VTGDTDDSEVRTKTQEKIGRSTAKLSRVNELDNRAAKISGADHRA